MWTRKRQLDNKRQSHQKSHSSGSTERSWNRKSGLIFSSKEPTCVSELWLSIWPTLTLLAEQQTHTPACLDAHSRPPDSTCISFVLSDVSREKSNKRQKHRGDIHMRWYIRVLRPSAWLLAVALLGPLHAWNIRSNTHAHTNTHTCPTEVELVYNSTLSSVEN